MLLRAGADFPPAEEEIWAPHQQRLKQELAFWRTLESPADPETAKFLWNRGSFENALFSLRCIVEHHPERIARTFSRLNLYLIPERNSSTLWQEIRAVVSTARKTLATLPREQAAAAEFQLVLFEKETLLSPEAEQSARLRRFMEQYSGTEAARLAEVELFLLENKLDLPERIKQLEGFARRYPGSVVAARALFQAGDELRANPDLLGLGVSQPDPMDRLLRVLGFVNEL